MEIDIASYVANHVYKPTNEEIIAAVPKVNKKLFDIIANFYLSDLELDYISCFIANEIRRQRNLNKKAASEDANSESGKEIYITIILS